MTACALALASLLLAAAPPGASDTAEAVERAIARAARHYDEAAALEALARARALAGHAPEARVRDLTVHAGLLAAELLRERFEQTPSKERTRDKLGEQIDAIAQESLGRIGSLPESSERYRIEADLLATLIRSDFRAKKYEKRFRAAFGRALELDPRNPSAIVSSAKPFLFAPPGRGRDLKQGITRLDRALELDPRLETALLLRARAREELGDPNAAKQDWRTLLSMNPDCVPARRALENGPTR